MSDGMTRGKFWQKIDNNIIECNLCPRKCRLKNGQKGFCFGRENKSGEMIVLNYEKCSTIAIDPMEKKPLYHFYPGSKILSFGTIGCNLDCKFCQNWNISRFDNVPVEELKIDSIMEVLKLKKINNIAFTYNEPITFAEFAMDVADSAHDNGFKTVCVSSGYISEDAREKFFSKMDAANIDLKSFSEEFYRTLCSGSLNPVLENLIYLKNETKVWLELTTLLIPGRNDGENELKAMIDWVLKYLGEDVPWHFSAFHPAYKLNDVAQTEPERVLEVRDMAIRVGAKYVYAGNISDRKSSNTYCANCGKVLIERNYYEVKKINLKENNKCLFCGFEIPGYF